MSKPAHKQDVADHAPGQLRFNPPEYITDKTLADYIRREKMKDAFDAVAKEKKLTFEQWWRVNYKHWLNYEDYSNLNDDLAKAVWKAAQENK